MVLAAIEARIIYARGRRTMARLAPGGPLRLNYAGYLHIEYREQA